MTRETRRPRSPGRRAGVLLALPVLASAAACAPEGDTRRPSPADREVALVERKGVTRPAFSLPPNADAPFALSARDVGAGRFLAWLAVRGAGEEKAHAAIELDAGGACEASFASAADDAAWQPCEIPLGRARDAVRAAIRFDGPPASELLVAAPIFEARASRAAKPPVFVVVLDTARADGYRSFDPESPIGDALALLVRDGIALSRARAPSGWTRTSVATLFTGQSPFVHRVLDRLDVLGAGPASLPERLRDAGYRTHAWSTNPNVLARWGFARGFDSFEDVGTGVWALAKPDGERVLDRVEAEIVQDGAAGRFFYVHLMDPHQPYRPKPPSLSALDEKTGGRYALPAGAALPGLGIPAARVDAIRDKYRAYLGELLETDQQMDRLLSLLRERGAYEPALLAVVSDHGEEFLDHGGSGHGKTLYEEMLRVPVWLKLPGNRRAGTRIERDVHLADLMPTLLAALDLPVPERLDGVNLLKGGGDGEPPRPHLARLRLDGVDLGAVAQGGWKLVIDLASGREELYDLREDPGELENLSDAHPERSRALRTFFEAHRLQHEQGWHVRGCGGVRDGEVALRLRLPDGAAVETRMLEPEDRVAVADGEADVVLDLSRTPHPSKLMFGISRPTLADEDELLIRSASLEVHAKGEEPLLLALGEGDAVEPHRALRPQEHLERVRVPAGRSVRCAERYAPYLLVWRVDAPPAPPAEVDPALAERLRALGYGL